MCWQLQGPELGTDFYSGLGQFALWERSFDENLGLPMQDEEQG